MAIVVATTTKGKEPELHRVGGKRGWTQNVNYTDWAMNQTFYVGDWLCNHLTLSVANLFALIHA